MRSARRWPTSCAGCGRDTVEEPDHQHRWLLRTRRERPGCSTAEQRDELAPPCMSRKSIVRGDEDRIMIRPSSRPEARSLLGCQTVNELGAPVASSIPEQLPGHEPASARMGYEDGHALFLRYRRVEGPLGRGGAA